MNVDHLISIMKAMDIRFSINGSQISYQEAFSETGYLPGLAKRADQLSSLCLGYGLGFSFEEDKTAKLGSRVKYDDSTPNVLRYLCLADVVSEIQQSSSVDGMVRLDELTYE